jgi:hypothetical protein
VGCDCGLSAVSPAEAGLDGMRRAS